MKQNFGRFSYLEVSWMIFSRTPKVSAEEDKAKDSPSGEKRYSAEIVRVRGQLNHNLAIQGLSSSSWSKAPILVEVLRCLAPSLLKIPQLGQDDARECMSFALVKALPSLQNTSPSHQ